MPTNISMGKLIALLTLLIVTQSETAVPAAAAQPQPAPVLTVQPSPDSPKLQIDGNVKSVDTKAEIVTHSPGPADDALEFALPQLADEVPLGQPTVDNAQTNEEFNQYDDPLLDQVMEKQQQQAEEEIQQQELASLHQWVKDQLEIVDQADALKSHEIFSFDLDDEREFKWNPSEARGNLSFVVEAFNFVGEDIYYPENPEEEDFIEVFTKPEGSSAFMSLGKVYMKKLFTIRFFTDFQIIKLVNHYDQRMIAQVSLEATKIVAEKGLVDDALKPAAERVRVILEDLEQNEKKREKTFMSEWSFKDRQDQHQSEMLVLTGIELCVILATAVVQIYCIKNLFDNRLVV